MKKISSSSTFYFKRVFPVAWFGLIMIFGIIMFFVVDNKEIIPIILMSITVLTLLEFFIIKNVLNDLADEVFDYGDYLIVKMDNFEKVIYLKDITNVGFSIALNPPKIALRVRGGVFGKNEVCFIPRKNETFCLNLLQKNAVVEDLIERVISVRNHLGLKE